MGVSICCLSKNSTLAAFKVLRVAHRNFISLVTQFHQRSEHWNPDHGIYRPWNRYIYGRLRIPTLDTMIHNQTIAFKKRFNAFCTSVRRIIPVFI